jgi:hypothetical protein
MKNLTNILLGIVILLLLVNIGLHFYPLHKLTSKENVTIEAVKEPSPFDNLTTDPYYNVPTDATGPTTAIQFDKEKHDFGKMKEGDVSHTVFTFTNTGTEDLFISNAVGSCGCTVPEWPKEAIKAGKSGEIKVEFDSHGKQGEQLKTVTVTSNTDKPNTVLSIKAVILPKP